MEWSSELVWGRVVAWIEGTWQRMSAIMVSKAVQLSSCPHPLMLQNNHCLSPLLKGISGTHPRTSSVSTGGKLWGAARVPLEENMKTTGGDLITSCIHSSTLPKPQGSFQTCFSLRFEGEYPQDCHIT